MLQLFLTPLFRILSTRGNASPSSAFHVLFHDQYGRMISHHEKRNWDLVSRATRQACDILPYGVMELLANADKFPLVLVASHANPATTTSGNNKLDPLKFDPVRKAVTAGFRFTAYEGMDIDKQIASLKLLICTAAFYYALQVGETSQLMEINPSPFSMYKFYNTWHHNMHLILEEFESVYPLEHNTFFEKIAPFMTRGAPEALTPLTPNFKNKIKLTAAYMLAKHVMLSDGLDDLTAVFYPLSHTCILAFEEMMRHPYFIKKHLMLCLNGRAINEPSLNKTELII